MSLRVDPDFEKAFQPLAAALGAAPRFPVGDVNQRRAAFEAMIHAFPVEAPPSDIEITKHTCKSFDGTDIGIWRFKPAKLTEGPVLLHVHGGGYIAGSVEAMATGVAKLISSNNSRMASFTGVQVFSVDYRLAPEAQHPKPVEDCYSGLLWVLEHAEEFHIDLGRVAVMGESAGGGLAAATAIMARDRKLNPPLAKQILIYPMVDDRCNKDLSKFEQFLIWKGDDNKTGWQALLGNKAGTDAVDPTGAAARVKDVTGLPSTYIDAGSLDLFADENLQFVAKLAAGGIDVEFHLYPGVPHAFEMLAPALPLTQRAIENRARAIRSF